MEENFFAVGTDEKTGKSILSFKSANKNAGVLLSEIIALILINTNQHYWIFWLASVNGKVKGHTVSGKKEKKENGLNILSGLECDLLEANFEKKKLFTASSLEETKNILIKNLQTTEDAAKGIIKYLMDNINQE